MRTLGRMRKHTLTAWPFVASLFVAIAPLTAAAEDAAPTSSQGAQGPMIVERVKSGFLVAPDFKVTEVDHRTSELAGAYAGWVTDNTLLVGGGGYWLTSRSRDREMACTAGSWSDSSRGPTVASGLASRRWSAADKRRFRARPATSSSCRGTETDRFDCRRFPQAVPLSSRSPTRA